MLRSRDVWEIIEIVGFGLEGSMDLSFCLKDFWWFVKYVRVGGLGCRI